MEKIQKRRLSELHETTSGFGRADPHTRFWGRCERLAERFFQLRPELRSEAGRRGIDVVARWLWQRSAGFHVPEDLHAGEVFWSGLLCSPGGNGLRVEETVDAAAGFIGFLGAMYVLPAPQARTLRQQAREEGLAFLAMTMGLLSDRDVGERVRRFALGARATGACRPLAKLPRQ